MVVNINVRQARQHADRKRRRDGGGNRIPFTRRPATITLCPAAIPNIRARSGWADYRTGARMAVVTGPYALAIMAVALLLAAWAFGLVLANRPPGTPLLAGGAVLEALLIGFLIGGVAQMIGSHRAFARAEFVIYLLACVAIPPAATAWGGGSGAGQARPLSPPGS